MNESNQEDREIEKDLCGKSEEQYNEKIDIGEFTTDRDRATTRRALNPPSSRINVIHENENESKTISKQNTISYTKTKESKYTKEG